MVMRRKNIASRQQHVHLYSAQRNMLQARRTTRSTLRYRVKALPIQMNRVS